METIKEGITYLFNSIFTTSRMLDVLWSVLLLIFVIFLFRLIRKIVSKIVETRVSVQIRYMIDKSIYYAGIIVAVMTIFNRLGINFSAILGAAGIAGIALGFAAQTSVSNVISGLFIMTERAFKIGDILNIDSVTGIVESFDLLAVRLRTFDNQQVRIPNETIIKTNLVNITHFVNRRFDLHVGVAYGSDLRKVREIVLDVVKKNEFALEDPAPLVIFNGFGNSSVNIMLGVWGETPSYLDLKNTITLEVYERFNEEGIIIPFPQLDIHMPQPSTALRN